jgi:hypothetical protein
MFVISDRKKHFTRISMSYTYRACDKAKEGVSKPMAKGFKDRPKGTPTKPHATGGMY